MQTFVAADFAGTELSVQTISRHILGMLYTVKQVRIEPATCNNDINKQKRREFALKLKQHQDNGDYIVYYDETNYNVYCKRSFGRSKKEREPPSCCRRRRARTCKSSAPCQRSKALSTTSSNAAASAWNKTRCSWKKSTKLSSGPTPGVTTLPASALSSCWTTRRPIRKRKVALSNTMT
ncbi:hypothetical protein AaE_015729 [Aphanomyces astaci]|uniref:Tc1-like transposase DDE domain-containing protein n=1 Tax=Aphanomyces astaci TaxID=112090 RepID=A0A6A4YZ79_APHAT|nr:hypothetical protein AaE_015729 [Aphanomyces astaci]